MPVALPVLHKSARSPGLSPSGEQHSLSSPKKARDSFLQNTINLVDIYVTTG
jgi:hypothetical protein